MTKLKNQNQLPTSPTLDDSMILWPDCMIRCWLAGLGWLLSSIHRFIDSSHLAAGLAGWLGWAGLGWLAAWLAISSIFIDFRGFNEISWIPGVGVFAACAAMCCP